MTTHRTKVTGWQELLVTHVDDWRNRKFIRGTNDCVQFVAEWVTKCAGEEYRTAFPAYHTDIEAARILVAAGGMAKLLNSCLGERIHPSAACRGDVLLFSGADGPAPGLCLGVYGAGFALSGGLEFVRTLSALAAWRV